MIHYVDGNIFHSNAEALVNPVNCVGVMGKGLALTFRITYPEMYKAYADRCACRRMRIGEIHAYKLPPGSKPIYILNFPTKLHWRDGSQLVWIVKGLNDLCKRVEVLGVKSVALPRLGCGLGGLPWPRVKEIMEWKLSRVPGVEFYIYSHHKD